MFLDPANETLHLSVVYAGPPLSGKTASLQHLMIELLGDEGRDVLISPQEAQGRTLYFDWTSYQGGAFRGYRISCQIIAVPGQESLVQRRQTLVRGADAIVFVADAQPAQTPANEASLAELQSWQERGGAPIPVVLQCNKMDLTGSLTEDELREELRLDPEIAVVETSALDGLGLRRAFVLAVREAVRAAAAALEHDRLAAGSPTIDSADALMLAIRDTEQGDDPGELIDTSLMLDVPTGSGEAHDREWLVDSDPNAAEASVVIGPEFDEAEESKQTAEEELASRELIDAAVPEPYISEEEASKEKAVPSEPSPGFPGSAVTRAAPEKIWRRALAQAEDSATPHRMAGYWQGRLGGGWYGRAVFTGDPKDAQGAFARWDARLEDAKGDLHSTRCLVLNPGDEHSVWQVVQRIKTLSAFTRTALSGELPTKDAARWLIDACTVYLGALERFAGRYPIAFANLGREQGRTVFTDFLPGTDEHFPAPAPRDALRRELRALIGTHRGEHFDTPAAVRELDAIARNTSASRDKVELVQALLIA